MQQLIKRRRFITTTIGAATGMVVRPAVADEEDPYLSLRAELLNELSHLNYDWNAPDSALIAVMSDAHIFLGTDYPAQRTEHWDDQLVAELNALHPPITNLVIAGDLITYRSMTPGSPRYLLHEQWAIQEYALARAEVRRFHMPLLMVPGNHDTDAYETDAEMFAEQMGVPVYQRVEMAGVPILLLNTGNAGMLNPAQEAWLRAEAAAIEPDREVLIIQHIPTFSTVHTQAGSKRIIAEAFQHRTAPVFIASGHNHRFDEGVTEYRGTRFVQMATTTASRVVFNDKKNPGYLLLALRGGEIIARIQRSLTVSGFWPRPAVSEMVVTPVRFPFDGVESLIAYHEEGFYDRAGVIEFSGVHVGCYIAYCKWVRVRIVPGAYHGRIRRFIVAGLITASAQPTCWISTTGAEGPWRELDFPAAKGSGLYEVTIPEEYANSSEIHLKLDTGLSGNIAGFSWSGWAIASDADSLSGYEKWLLGLYGTLRKTPENGPEAVVVNGRHGNLVTYAFNLAPYSRGSIAGMPEFEFPVAGDGDVRVVVRYVRFKNPSAERLVYHLQAATDVSEWRDIPADDMVESVVLQDELFEKVEVSIAIPAGQPAGFFRVAVEHLEAAAAP
jgi:Icc-related predicted phosphoesterase